MVKWISLWYQYLFKPWGGLGTAWCRLRGHPSGVVWYTNSTATEPDMHCKNCGDDLG